MLWKTARWKLEARVPEESAFYRSATDTSVKTRPPNRKFPCLSFAENSDSRHCGAVGATKDGNAAVGSQHLSLPKSAEIANAQNPGCSRSEQKTFEWQPVEKDESKFAHKMWLRIPQGSFLSTTKRRAAVPLQNEKVSIGSVDKRSGLF